jgi:hypothetical protein
MKKTTLAGFIKEAGGREAAAVACGVSVVHSMCRMPSCARGRERRAAEQA